MIASTEAVAHVGRLDPTLSRCFTTAFWFLRATWIHRGPVGGLFLDMLHEPETCYPGRTDGFLARPSFGRTRFQKRVRLAPCAAAANLPMCGGQDKPPKEIRCLAAPLVVPFLKPP